MLVAVVGPLVIVPAIGATGLFVGGSALRMLFALAAPAVLGGAFAGRALQRGWRGTLAFAVAFPVGTAIPILAVSTLDALSGRESLTQLTVAYVGLLSISFGTLGAVGASLSGFKWSVVGRVLLAFASCGVVGGLVLTGMASLLPEAPTGIAWLRMSGSAAALIIPAAGCGWWLGRLSP